MRPVLLALVLSVVGCGVDHGFVGTWSGTSTLTLDDTPACCSSAMVTTETPLPSSMVITQTEGGASVRGICPDGSGTIEALPDESGMIWTGPRSWQPDAFKCEAVNTQGCTTRQLVLESVAFSLHRDGTITVRALGLGPGCASDPRIEWVFTGSK